MKTTDATHKLKIAVLFGGRSGEHEVSLVSAKSVLSVLDPDKYEVFQVGITHEGAWLTGANARDLLEKGETKSLTPCTLLPDPSKPGLYVLRSTAQCWKNSPILT